MESQGFEARACLDATQEGFVIEIDGSYGEGGGQVLRTSLALAILTQQSTRISRIRAGRRKPGLAPQHLTVVRALASLCDADVQGDSIGSTELVFQPRSPVEAGDYHFDVAEASRGGSAGAVTLIFQALLYPLLSAPSVSYLTLQGGTHVAWSPPFDHLTHVYFPMISRMGVQLASQLERSGFYPAGGGQLMSTIVGQNLSVQDGDELVSLRPLMLETRGELQQVTVVVTLSQLPPHIAQRMIERVQAELRDIAPAIAVEVHNVDGPGPGVSLCLVAEYAHVLAGFSVLGEKGKSAEQVADEACQALLEHDGTGLAVEEHLADQLLLPMALARGRSGFRTSCVTQHLLTNAHIIRHFVPVHIEIQGDEGQTGEVVIE
ncbi:MAG: RNA 3'-terminal phosphate cyclase [Chloroflexota bacterium]